MTGSEEEPRASLARRAAAVLLPLAFFLAVTLPSADFGYHWDEPWGQIRPAKIALERGSLVTGYYIYPGLNLWLNLSALAPDYLASRDLVEAVEGRAYLLRARRVRIAVVSLAIVWVYLLALALARPVPEALLAAALLALSWEVVYHSRWLAPDALVMQFGTLAVGCAVAAEGRPRNRRWTVLAAVAAGLACGTKYPAGLVLLPAALVVLARPGTGARERLKLLALIGLIFAATFLLTTPGAVLDFREFKSTLVRLREIYSDGWLGYTVARPHLGKLLSYLGSSALSPLPAVAWSLFGCAVWGAGRLVLAKRRPALILLAFPAAYAAYFSLQKVMIVRNYQILIPFVAVLAAIGIGDVWRRLPRAWLRAAWTLAVLAAVAANAAWQVEACRDILGRADQRGVLRQLDERLRAEPETRFFLSPGMVEALAALDTRPWPNLVEESSRGSVVVTSLRELPAEFPANRGRLLAWLGPREVDLNRYPSWEGQDRPVILPMAAAVRVPLALGQLVRREVVFHRSAGRQALFLAGDERAGDQLYVESTPDGVARFGLTSWGEGRAALTESASRGPAGRGPLGFSDESLRLEPGRPYPLTIDWGVGRGELRVILGDRLVFSRYGPLHEARLDQLRVGAAAALPGRGAAAFSGELGPAAEPGPWRPLAASPGDPRRLAFAEGAERGLRASLWEADAGDLETARSGDALVVATSRERFAPAAWYGPLVLPADGEYLFTLSFQVEAPSVLGPLWDDGALALGVLSEDRGRWLAFARTRGRISEWNPTLTIRVFARAGRPVWLAALNDPPRERGACRLTLGKLDVLVRATPHSALVSGGSGGE